MDNEEIGLPSMKPCSGYRISGKTTIAPDNARP